MSDGKRHIVAVSGGTTMAAMAANLTGSQPNTVVVPARGGLGDNVELQANTIATVLAQKMGASYRQLYVPDCVSEDILNSILKEDVGVRSVVDIIKKADILVHGVGRASVMARHRRLAPELIAKLEEAGAAAVGFNCVAADNLTAGLVSKLRRFVRGPLVCKPNAGNPVIGADNLPHFPMGPDEFSGIISDCVQVGAAIVGGCCGTDPTFICAVKEKLTDR